MTSLLFFGAGASRPFGIPTMQEMVSDFENTLKDDRALYDFYFKIKNVLIKEYGDSKIDIESILSVVAGISKETKPVDLGHFAFYYASQNCSGGGFSVNEKNLAGDLEEKLQQYIKEKCSTSGQQHNNTYKMSYLPLFKHMEGIRMQYEHGTLCRDWKAYTTNYDNIFEDFWRAFEPPTDHFERIGDSVRYAFRTNLLQQEHTFSKLHGSLDWTKEVSSSKIVREESPIYSPVETKGEIMLFPIQQKDLYLHPWFTLFQDLKTGLSAKQKWYVIGYAFNDEFVRNVFQESLVDDSSKKLILINPEANEVKNKFSQHVQTQIDILPIRFGDKFFELQFGDYVKGIKTVIMRFKTTPSLRQEITIESNALQSAKILNDVDTGFTVNLNFDGNGRTHDQNQKHVQIMTTEPKQDVEVELELKLQYNHGDEVELCIHDITGTYDFDIHYGSKTIFICDEASKKDATKDYTLEMIPIKISSTDLYV